MPHIELLDQITIDKIAAGEVIERPASVVKELVENAIDAGSTAVTVEIEEGGISLIRITDNGCGIAKQDVENAFLRHSTSKIRSAEDLTHLSSLGFRGEALSSISAVARVELITKTREDVFGTKYIIEGGKGRTPEETGAPDGTTFLVRQLFFNTPARRKFLKTPMTEASHISDLLTRLALSHPDISFRFINNGQVKLHTSGNGKMKDVIYHIYGREIANNLIPLEFEKDGVRLSGYLGKPVINRGNRNFENYFVNGRYVRNSILAKAIEDGYKDFTMQHKFPFAVLHFQVEGDLIDVNVHPTKMELRFQRQQEVYNTMYEAVHRRLLEPELIQTATVPDPADAAQKKKESPFLLKPKSIENTKYDPIEKIREKMQEREPEQVREKAQETKPEQVREKVQDEEQGQARKQTSAIEADKESVLQSEPQIHDEDYFIRKMRERVKAYHERSSSAEVLDRGEIYRPQQQAERIREAAAYRAKEADKTPKQMDLFEENFLKREVKAEYTLIGQVFDTYWLVQFQDSLYIIDQHAAHERVMYERTLKEMKSREYTSQYLSPPIILSLSMQEAQLLEEHIDRFTRIGFEIEHFGGEEYAVRAVPDNLFGIAKKELLMEMIDDLADGINTSMTPDLIDEKVASMSCKAAVKGNNRLSAKEVDALIGELLTLDNPYHCPHGRPTIIAMTKRELEKKFKRIV